MMERVGDWMQISGGDQFWPLDPRPEEITIEQIAHGLSRQCRYGGHVKDEVEHYSTAEHSFHISHTVPPEHALAALLHDAPESFLQDVIRPIKPYLTEYKPIEDRLQEMIFIKYGLDPIIPNIVHEHDMRICVDERDQVMDKPKVMWMEGVEPLGVTIQCWSPSIAKKMFLTRFHELYHG
jgi:hypothetical protein